MRGPWISEDSLEGSEREALTAFKAIFTDITGTTREPVQRVLQPELRKPELRGLALQEPEP